MNLLIFPATLHASIEFSQEAKRWGHSTFGAASIQHLTSLGNYDKFDYLPFINDSNFFNELTKLTSLYDIDYIFTPHGPTYTLLSDQLHYYLPNVKLFGSGPFAARMNEVDKISLIGSEILVQTSIYGSRNAYLSSNYIGSIVNQAEKIHGECSREKMCAIFSIIPNSPKGDIIEIGSLFGKSTYLLNRISSKFNIGPMLAIDSWSLNDTIQVDASRNIQKASGNWDWDKVATGFLMNMLSLSVPEFNYLRMTSESAYHHYLQHKQVTSEEFSTTKYSNSISILHIDGNHDEESVLLDFNLWSKHLQDKGWIIFDDYNWPHGDGPRNVADYALNMYGDKVIKKFVAGGAMFMQLSLI